MFGQKLLILLLIAYIVGNLVQSGDASFVFVGMNSRKSFFADHTLKNWTAANKSCISMNMNLASIDNEEDLACLKRAYKSGVFSGYDYWLSRTNSLTLNPVWHKELPGGISKTVRATIPIPFYLQDHCIAFEALPTSPRVRTYPCSRSNGYTLCETIHQR